MTTVPEVVEFAPRVVLPAAEAMELQPPATRLKKLLAFVSLNTTEDARAVETADIVLMGPELPRVLPRTHVAGMVAILAKVMAPFDTVTLILVPICPLPWMSPVKENSELRVLTDADVPGFPMRLFAGRLAIFPRVIAPLVMVAALDPPTVPIHETSPVILIEAPNVAGVAAPPVRLPIRHPAGIVAIFARVIAPAGIVAAAEEPIDPT